MIIRFEKGEITLEVDVQQYLQIMSLLLVDVPIEAEISEDIIAQVYTGVWATEKPGRAKSASPVKLKEG